MICNRQFFYSVENAQIQNIYWRAEQKYRKHSKMLTIILLAYDQSTYVSAFISSIGWILGGNTDVSTWPVVLELSVPFDKKTICGWYLLLLVTACMDLAYMTSMLFGTTQFIGCCICMYIAATCEHLDLMMQNVQENLEQNCQAKNTQSFNGTSANANFKAQISEAIKAHIKIYE